MSDAEVATDKGCATESTDLAQWTAGGNLQIGRTSGELGGQDGNVGLQVRQMHVYEVIAPEAKQQVRAQKEQVQDPPRSTDPEAWQPHDPYSVHPA